MAVRRIYLVALYSLVVVVVSRCLENLMSTAPRCWRTFPGSHWLVHFAVGKLHVETQAGIVVKNLKEEEALSVAAYMSLAPCT